MITPNPYRSGGPNFGGESKLLEGRLGSPNPTANPIGEHQAYDEAQILS